MKLSKKLSSKSGLTIPKQMRAELGYRPGMGVDLVTTEQGEVVIRPHAVACRLCGGQEDVVSTENINLCKTCIRALAVEANRHE